MIQFNNREYSLDKVNGIPKLIQLNNQDQIPQYLSKYYTINKYSVENFVKSKLFVSSYDHLNDITDSLYMRIEFENIGFDKLWNFLSQTDLNYDNEKRKFENNPKQYRAIIRDTIHAIFLPFIGFFCVTENQNNELMWSHYAKNDGFLVEFDIEKLPKIFGKPLKINYLNEFSAIKAKADELTAWLFLNLIIKKDIWEYESEYRFLVTASDDLQFETQGIFSNKNYTWPKASRLIDINLDAYSKVVLGFNFFKGYEITKSDSKRIVEFTGDDGILKSLLLDFINHNSLSLEWVVLDLVDFKFKRINIVVEKLSYLKSLMSDKSTKRV
jgi:hypothetical protein